ncbi:MAG TPA: phosphoribosyltransferase family protein, partial [Terrimesophilobacter sp.]|nr:phosphoribosyltransferase family protein [Terrimesophilobacter sp.]
MLEVEVRMLFKDRSDAGRQLAQRLEHLRGRDLVVLGLPRGGVPVAYEVAKALDAPLDVVVIRKLGAPFNSEFAIGAIGEGVRVVDEAALRQLGISDGQLVEIETREEAELQR